MRPLVPTGQRFLASEMPLTGALKPIDQHMQEELMGGTDLPIQLLLSQIKPQLLGKRGSLAQVVILGIDNDAVHVKDNGVERKCGHGTLPNKRTPASRRPNHALIGDSTQQLIQRHRNTIFVVIGGHHLATALTSSTALPMATPVPAHSIMDLSFWPSPNDTTSLASMPSLGRAPSSARACRYRAPCTQSTSRP